MIEAKLRLSGEISQAQERGRYLARFVRAGEVRAAGNEPSGIVVEPGALQAAVEAGLFEAKAVFVDHAGFFEHPSLRNLAGVTGHSFWNPVTESVDGEILIYSGAGWVAGLVDELLGQADTARPDVGLSIVFWPVLREDGGRETSDGYVRGDGKLRIVGIKHVESVDLVFEPAADGRILQALSAQLSALDVKKLEVEEMSEEKDLYDGTPEGERDLVHPGSPMAGGQTAWDMVRAGEWQDAMCRAAVGVMIGASGLPEVSQERLAAREYETPWELQTAIVAERAYIASLAENQVVQVGGTAPRGGHIQGGMDGFERFSLALEALIGGVQPGAGVEPLSGIREAYIRLSGDYEMTGVFQGERVQFANVNSSTMAGLVANALNKSVVNFFQEYPRWWEQITLPEDYTSLQAVKWITLGGVGELPTVAEGAAYTELTWDDQTESGSFVKKGGYLGLTLEAMDKDDTRRLQAAPRALAQAAWLTLSKAISYIFTQSSGVGPTMSDSLALFHTTHGNLGTSALSVSTWAAARLAMRKMAELNSGERLGALTAPRYLLVPPDLEITALQVLASEHDYLYALSNGTAAPVNAFAEGSDFQARMNAARSRVIVVDLWTDANDWTAVADPRLYPTIGLAFRYGRTPEIFSVASPTAGLMFTNDTLPVKVRFFFATGPMDWRGLYKANV